MNTPHVSLSVQNILEEGVVAVLPHTCADSQLPGVDNYSDTHYLLSILQLGSLPQDLAALPHAVRSARHVHPDIQPTVMERTVH